MIRMSGGRRRFRRVGIGCLTLVVAAFGYLYFTGGISVIRNLISHGFLDEYISPEQARKYTAGNEANLKALYTAISNYHESEGQFPKADKWMDAIKSYGAASDLAKGEADKKFVSPTLAGKPNQFGYAINDAVAGKYKGDIKDPKTPLIFDSIDTSRNAHGDPKKLLPSPPRPGGNLAVAVDGTILKL